MSLPETFPTPPLKIITQDPTPDPVYQIYFLYMSTQPYTDDFHLVF